MIEHNKNFYSLEELKRTRDNLEGYLDNEEVYYFVGAIRYACDEIERLENIIKEERLENIIKEVRERLIKPSKFIERTGRLKLLEILDKENK